MKAPGFLRLVATAVIDGRTYRGVGTAGIRAGQDSADAGESAGLRQLLGW